MDGYVTHVDGEIDDEGDLTVMATAQARPLPRA